MNVDERKRIKALLPKLREAARAKRAAASDAQKEARAAGVDLRTALSALEEVEPARVVPSRSTRAERMADLLARHTDAEA